MPDYLPLSGAPIAKRNEGNDTPSALMAFGSFLDSHFNLFAADEADRDAKYATAAAGTIVSCPAKRMVWQKITDETTTPVVWHYLSRTVMPVSDGVVTEYGDWDLQSQWAFEYNGMITVELIFLWNGAADIVGGAEGTTQPGNITDTRMGTISTDWLPARLTTFNGKATFASGAGDISAVTGAITLKDLKTSGKIFVGNTVSVQLSYLSKSFLTAVTGSA